MDNLVGPKEQRVQVWQRKWIENVTDNVEKWQKRVLLCPFSFSSKEKNQLTLAGMQILLQTETHMHAHAHKKHKQRIAVWLD
jgi:hypothetical protein